MRKTKTKKKLKKNQKQKWKKPKTPTHFFKAAVGCKQLPFQVAAAARQPAATQPGPAVTVANLPPFTTAAGAYRQMPRRKVPTTLSNSGRNPTAIWNGRSRLFLPTLNPAIYFRKIKEKIYKKFGEPSTRGPASPKHKQQTSSPTRPPAGRNERNVKLLRCVLVRCFRPTPSSSQQHNCTEQRIACSFGWWLMAGDGLFWEISTVSWFVVREKYCWLVADKPNERGAGCSPALHVFY
jgi:hypothetical protein